MEDNDAAQAGTMPTDKSSPQTIAADRVASKKAISSYQLFQLAHHQQKLLDRIRQLNNQGILHIQAHNYPEALIFFNECEKTLEYAASCGSTIDRNLILAILNNEAVTYQCSQEQEKSASYVEAIIYNLKMFLDSHQNQHLFQQLGEQAGNYSQRNELETFLKIQQANFYSFFTRKYESAVYLLQFSGLQSQCQFHSESLNNARKALSTMKELCRICQNYLSLKGKQNAQSLQQLREMSEFPLNFDRSQYEALKKTLEQLLKGQHESSNRSYACDQPSEQGSLFDNITFEEIFSLSPKSVDSSVLEQESQQSKVYPFATHQSHLRKILIIICTYFTIGVQLQELTSQELNQCSSIYLFGSEKKVGGEDNVIAEMYHLMALIVGFKYLPHNNKFLQHLLLIYRENYNHVPAESHISQTKSINKNLDKLTEKYKNYLMEKNISISFDDQSSSIAKVDPQVESKWNEQKKESKKLNDLFKQETPQISNQRSQEDYFLEVPSIDSIEMVNSLSGRKQESSITDEKNDFKLKKTKIHLHPKLKASKHNLLCEYSSKPGSFYPTPPQSNRNHGSEKSREEQFHDNTKKGKVNTNNNSKKPKSTKKSKSKAKLVETKKIEKVQSNGTLTSIPMLGLMTTITDRSCKKLKSKRSPEKQQHKFMNGSAGGEYTKMARDLKQISSSEHIKPFKTTQFASVKNVPEPIKMNKVKGVSKINSSIPINELKSYQTIRFEQTRQNNNDNSQKSKSKNKNSASFKSKKSISNSKGKKSLTKTITTSKQKIYTSIKQTIKRR